MARRSARTAPRQVEIALEAGVNATPRSPSTALPLEWLLAALLLVSGLSALVYQVVWIKQLALVVGVDVYAVTTGVSAFFMGLALGGALWGRWADRSARPLWLYAALELAVGVTGMAATGLLGQAAPWFVALQSHVGPLAWALPFVLIGVPALLMGGTLPALISAAAPLAGRLAHAGGRLYAANTLGAVFGALACTFVLIPALGVQGTALAAATLNVLLAFAAYALTSQVPVRTQQASAIPTPTPVSAQQHLAVGLYAVAGGVALGYEIIWSQTIVQFMSTRSFAFSIVLATYLTGLMLGSALYARHADRVRNPWLWFGLLIAAAGLLALLQVAGLGGWLLAAQSSVAAWVRDSGGTDLQVMCARFLLAAVCVVLLPTILLGAAFPAALRLCVQPGQVGRDVGRVLALNTAGGIVGTFVTGFVLVPGLGLVHTLAVLAGVAVAIALLAVWQQPARGPRLAVGTLALLVIGLGVLTPADSLARLLTVARGGKLVSFEESPGGTVAVLEQGGFRRLYIAGVSNSGDVMASRRYMRLQALLPLLVHHGEPKSTLVIALGTGITAGAMTQYPGLQHRVTAELLPAVARAVPLFKGNYNVTHDPGSEIRIHDGRHELLRNPQRYDVITLEPPPPSAAGVVNLYSRDFYALARSRMQPDGVFAQWLPIATQNDEDTRSLVRSFIDVFPNASLWTTELHEMLLVGSAEPMPLNAAQISARFNQPTVRQALGEVGIDSPAALLSTWVTDADGLRRYVDNAPAVTDDRPLIEYATWVRPREISRVLPALLALHVEVPLPDATPALRSEIEQRRLALMDFYAAGLAAYAGDRESWANALQRALAADPDNRYFVQFEGGK
ncbi:fused MFS/spermidine synthase [Amantichitinum ursilacus]|uniref:Spermidine synthase n=1 Tax=Amantichitinum ursilacus TaxID=857265 RepID=A0A0N0XN49_9NEIS|nr:fused MFS/spermidine synthase [Amantichitinum ursilacus]KPC55355.1 Spermidine synthase [Amantichitinum ursilacus]